MIKTPNLASLTEAQKEVLVISLLKQVNNVTEQLNVVTQERNALKEQLNAVTEQLNVMTKQLAKLNGKLAKNSHNSSKPPSLDGKENKRKPKPKSLREKGGKPGGQLGHPGKTLERVEKPDHIEIHPVASHCDDCGSAIDPASITLLPNARQVFDLPPIRFHVTGHHLETAECPCGKVHVGQFPANVSQPTQYGPNIRAAAVYLTHYQMLPVDRAAQALRDLFGLGISAGTIQQCINEAGEILQPAVEKIKEAIIASPVVHFDETGMRVGTTQNWLHSASTETLTFFGSHLKRGKEGLDSFDILPNFTGVAVHDGWKPYMHYDCIHALCNSHHLRELIFICDTSKQAWAQEMIKLLIEAKTEIDTLKAEGASKLPWQRIAYYRSRNKALMDEGFRLNPKQERDPNRVDIRGVIKQSYEYNLLARLERYRRNVWRFIYNFRVPFDNNLAERDIRMAKLKQKISGCFRTAEGLNAFCVIRSYLATLRKQGTSLFTALADSFNGNVQLPALG